jgi:YggT family protein
MGHFLEFVVEQLINLVVWVMVANAILSWLIVFEVVNLRNRAIYQISRFLDALTRPILRPVQKIIPPFGGVDISPIIVMIVLIGIQLYIVPMIFAPLYPIIG